MATNTNGHVLPAAFASPGTPYYAQASGGVIAQPNLLQPTIAAPITLQSFEEAGTLLEPARIFVQGENNPDVPYIGAVTIAPGGNDASAVPGAGITIRTGAGVPSGPSTIVEIGTDGEDLNLLLIAGGLGTSQVYDQKYNPAVSIQPINIVASDPDCVPSGVGNIFLCGQTAVAQAGAGVEQFNRFTVPRTGAYAFQTRFIMGNGAGANTVVLPSTLVGGVPVWNMLELVMSEFSTVSVVPFGVTEIIGGDFQAIDTFESNSFTARTYSTVVFLDSTKEYAIGLVSNSALWNIGTSGSISANLVAMC